MRFPQRPADPRASREIAAEGVMQACGRARTGLREPVRL